MLYIRILYEDIPTNLVCASTLQILSDFFIEYMAILFLAIKLMYFIPRIEDLINDDRIPAVFVSFCMIGLCIIGSIIVSILWLVAMCLGISYITRWFPDQDNYRLLLQITACVAIRILLVDVLHMPWGFFWRIL